MGEMLRDRLVRNLVSALGGLPIAVQRTVSGRAPISIDGQTLHPEMQWALKLLTLLDDSDPELSVADSRIRIAALARAFSGRRVAVAEVEDLAIPRAGGELRARRYVPLEPAAPAALLVYFHGGGWVTGDLETSDNVCRILAHHSGAQVLSVDYRLAPEHPFPDPIDDAYTAFRYAVENAESFDVDPALIAVGGDSAGANLAAVVCHLARRDGGVLPAFQLLLVPAVDLVSEQRSKALFAEGFQLTRTMADWWISLYLGSSADPYDPRVSPLLAPDLSGLPPAYIATAGFDMLRDQGAEYAVRLAAAGVPVVHRSHSGFIHPFAVMTGFSKAATAALIETAGGLRAGIAMTAQPTADRRPTA